MRTRILCAVVAVSGCNLTSQVETTSAPLPHALPGDVFDTLKDPAGAHAELCDHDASDTTFPADADRITNRFCQPTVPQPTGLQDLLRILDLDFKSPTGNGTNGNPAFAILGHSSALTAREVSSITPTAFLFTPLENGMPPRDYTFLAYDPGELFVEVAAFSPSDQAMNFYLVLFDKACGAQCGPDDLLTANQTTGWSNVRIYESTTELNNTIADCRQCHIGSGRDVPDTGDPLILRMQELDAPHTHWFSNTTTGGRALLDDFHAAHGGEAYGGIPGDLIDQSSPDLMAAFIKAAGFAQQPNAFPSQTVESEVQHLVPQQPSANLPMGWSSAWETVYQAGATGQAIAAPYHDVKVTDPQRLAVMTDLYANRGGGKLTDDIREVLLGGALIDMGFEPRPGLTGKQLLVQQCQQCHHARLDPTITRERFLVDQLDQMSRAEKDLAIERIKMPTTTRLTMPPPLFRLPSDADRAAMIDALSR